jgi:hypothetical protein
MSTYEEILEYVNTLTIIDTHEHLVSSEEKWLEGSWRQIYTPGKVDVLKHFLFEYFCYDLVSAGLPLSALEKVQKSDIPLLEKWDLVEEYWNYSRHTGYGRALDISAAGVYGIPRVERETIEQLNVLFLESLKPGKYRRVLKDLSKIKLAINHTTEVDIDDWVECDPTFFQPVFSLDSLVRPKSAAEIFQMEKRTGKRVTSFDAYLNSCERSIKWALSNGAVAFKSGIAYQRSLSFERTTRALAESEFNTFIDSIHRDHQFDQSPGLPGTNAENYIMHFLLELANERELILQIHTGLQEGTGNYIYWSDPALLTNLFIQYPDVRFAIFHIGYPYQQTLSALAKNFANVYIDMCWAHIISPEACIRAIVEWLDSVPYNKICGFGGDSVTLDVIYGHQFLARENISNALAIKVQQGHIDVDKAKEIATSLLWDNPLRIYRLKGID